MKHSFVREKASEEKWVSIEIVEGKVKSKIALEMIKQQVRCERYFCNEYLVNISSIMKFI